MKTILLSISLALTTAFLPAQNSVKSNSNGTTITVTVPCQSSEGKVLLGLYTEDTFMKAAPNQSAYAEIVDGKATATFENVGPGIYAISIFQDKNNNKQMDFEPNGMPKEPYGVSNNVMSFGPPMWADAKFEVANQPINMEIRI